MKPQGYDKYESCLASPLNRLDQNVVYGFFTWDNDPAYAHREIDVEFIRWGDNHSPENANFVVQPYARPGRQRKFQATLDASSTQVFDWQPDRVHFETRDSEG